MNNIHICMVSDQPLANILPILNEQIKPDLVYLLTSKQQANKNNHKAQEAVIKKLGISNVENITIENAFNLEEVQTIIENIINKHKQDKVMLNATGGTKPMSIAAYETCYSCNIDVFYLHSPQIIWLYPINRTPLNIDQSLSLNNFLAAHQIQILEKESKKIPEKRQKLSATWASRGLKYKQDFARLNYYASLADNNQLTPSKSISDNDWQTDFQHLIDELENENMLTIKKNNIVFNNEDSRFFANGGWLEEHLFNTLLDLQKKHPEITDVARSVKIKLPLDQVPKHLRERGNNELDTIVLVNNQLWVFECKTKKMKTAPNTDQIKEDDSQHMIYKLAGLMKTLGGLRTKGCVVSFNKIDDINKTRAQLFDINCIDGNNIADLKSKLTKMLLPN